MSVNALTISYAERRRFDSPWKYESSKGIAELSFDIDTRRSMETKKQVVSLLLSRDLLNPVNTLKTDALFDAYRSRKGIK